jgi:uncharacterized membrane protein YraQ (UPF0718 family)
MSSAKRQASGKTAKRRFAGWQFLGAVLLLHLGVYWLDPDLSALALTDFAQGLRRLLPVFGVMLVLMVLVNLWVKPQRIARHLGEESGLRGWAIAMTAGVVSLGPMYLWYPMLRELKEKGVRTPLLAAFLYSRAIKIPMLPVMVHYFGLLYTLLFVLNILLFSVLSGLGMDMLEGRFGRGR